MLRDIDKETVDWYPNYDDRLDQPGVLPARIPNLLVNGAIGIAVGMSTSIPPHNLGEVIDAVLMLIDNKEATVSDLMQKIKGPDFPTGGLVVGMDGVREAYNTGRGRIRVRAKSEIETDKNGRTRLEIGKSHSGRRKNAVRLLVLLQQAGDFHKSHGIVEEHFFASAKSSRGFRFRDAVACGQRWPWGSRLRRLVPGSYAEQNGLVRVKNRRPELVELPFRERGDASLNRKHGEHGAHN
jgi:hypothetical protein